MWAYWQELSSDEYDQLDRIVDTKNYGDLLAFVLERVSLLLDHFVRGLFLGSSSKKNSRPKSDEVEEHGGGIAGCPGAGASTTEAGAGAGSQVPKTDSN